MLAASNEDTWYKNEIDCYNSESSIRISKSATLGRWTDTTQRKRLPKRACMDIGPISIPAVLFEVDCGEILTFGPSKRLRHTAIWQLAMIYIILGAIYANHPASQTI